MAFIHPLNSTSVDYRMKFSNAMEVDRICVAKTHRDFRLYKVLWKGLAMCLLQDNKTYVFGSLSLATKDPMAAGGYLIG